MASPYWYNSFEQGAAYSPQNSVGGQPGPYASGYAYPTALGGSSYSSLGGGAMGASSGALGGWGSIMSAVSDYMGASREARDVVNNAKQTTKEVELRADEGRKTNQYAAQVGDWEVARDRHERFNALMQNYVNRARRNEDPRHAGTNRLMNYNSLNTPQDPGARPSAEATYDPAMRPRG
mgnify:CR=1 FL=1